MKIYLAIDLKANHKVFDYLNGIHKINYTDITSKYKEEGLPPYECILREIDASEKDILIGNMPLSPETSKALQGVNILAA